MEKSQLKSGVVLSYVNLGLGMLIPMFYTPVMLRILGQEEYGLYSLSNSVVSYLSLLSFGFGSTIIRYIAKCRAEGRKREEEETFGFFLALYTVLGAAVMLCGLFLSGNVEPIFQKGLTDAEQAKMQILVLIMSFNAAISFPISVFTSIITAHERYVYRKLVDMLSTVAAPIANLIALYLGYASVGMCLAGTILQFLMLPFSVVYCLRVLKVRPRFVRIPQQLIKEMVGFSLFVFLASIADMLFWAADKVILGMLVSSTAVAIYNVGANFNNMVINLSTSMSGVLMPRIAAMKPGEDTPEVLSAIFIKVGRMQFIIIALVVSGFTVFGQAFINLWAGPEYADAYWVTILTMFPLCIPLIQNTGHSIVVAQNRHQFRTIMYLSIAVVNVVSTYLIVPYLGMIGAALCSCIAYLAGQGVCMNWFYYKKLGINIPLFWKNILKMAVIPVLMLICGLLLRRYVSWNSWPMFFAGVIIYTAIYAVLMLRFALNEYEKNLLKTPLRKVLGKIK